MKRAAGAALLLLSAGCAGAGRSAPVQSPAQSPARQLLRASVALEQDFGLVYGSNVCGRESQLSRGFACFRANGTQYHGTALPDAGDDPAGGHVATTRVLLGLDYTLRANWTLGARGGLVVRGASPRQDGASAPETLLFHGEARAAYWLGTAPLARPGFRWGVFVAGGAAQVDTAFRVRVEEDTSRLPAAAQPNNPSIQTLDAYQKAGTGFLGGGAIMTCSFSRSGAFLLEMKVMQLFPSPGTAVASSIGYEHAF